MESDRPGEQLFGEELHRSAGKTMLWGQRTHTHLTPKLTRILSKQVLSFYLLFNSVGGFEGFTINPQ